jgi:hypothetical protein
MAVNQTLAGWLVKSSNSKRNFMKSLKSCNLFLIFTVVFLFIQIKVNAQVTVVLQQPPSFQFKLEHIWKVTLINPTNVTYSIYLRGVVTESSEGQIVEINTAAFTLPPGVKIVNAHDLFPLQMHVDNNKYTDVVENINAVPTGNYEICVTVINAATKMQLGMQCIQAQTQNLSQVELLQPENSTKFLSGSITENNADNIGDFKIIPGSFINFSWLPPSPVPPGVKASYSLRIAEIYGNQSAYDAILSNPAYYINQNIYTNVFVYPVEGRKFQNNKRYAWKVIAYLNNTQMSESETWEFSYTDNTQNNSSVEKTFLDSKQENSSDLFYKKQLLVASADDSQLLQMMADNNKESAIVPFLFSGNAKISFDAGYKSLPFSELPKNILTASLNPSIALYGLPFTANFLLTTQQGTDKQNMNSASFNFDLNSYKEQLKSRLENKVSELATAWEKLLLGVNVFGVGTNYPSYTDYTLKGVPVTGITAELNPGILYAAFTASKNQSGIDNVAYQRSIYAGRLGIGKVDGTHLFFTGMYAKDDENSITVSPDNLTLTPKANYVFGAQTKLVLFDQLIMIEGEGNASVLTRDTRDADLEMNAIPGWIKGLISPKISSSFDYSYTGKITVNNPESATRVSFDLKMVGPGYISLGAPDLRNDLFTYEAKLDQGFLSNKITVSSFFRTSHDNLIDWKSSTTTTTAYGINLGLHFPKLPFLQVSYSPYVQKNDDTISVQKVENKTMMLSAITGYSLLIQQFNFSTSVAFTNNTANTLTGLSDYKTNSFNVTEAVSFNNPISFAGTWGVIKTNSSNLYSHIDNYDLSINATFIESLFNTLGLNIESERSINKKTGIYLNSTYSPLKNINLSARIEESNYKNLADNSLNYNELIFNLALNVNW